jgi:hypothetical protein
MNASEKNNKSTGEAAVESSALLGVGTRILVRFGLSAEEGTIFAAGEGRYGVRLDFGSRELWTLEELKERRYIVLPPKPKKLSWLSRLLTPNSALRDSR